MKLRYCILIVIITSMTLRATVTMQCRWHAAYFDAEFWGNYGRGAKEEEDRYFRDIIHRAQIIMQLDSTLRALRRQGKMEHFKRWFLCDLYMRCYDYKDRKLAPRTPWHEGDTVFLCITDSLSINYVLEKYWGQKDIIISPGRQSGMWLYSLHTIFSKDRYRARQYPDTLMSPSPRGDSAFLWLCIDGGIPVKHNFYQYEIDGYYHQYTGLYITTADVLNAQTLLFQKYGIKTTITSHYVTPVILRKYIWY